MVFANKFYSITVEQNSFYITETNTTPKYDDAYTETLLKRIETVIKLQLPLQNESEGLLKDLSKDVHYAHLMSLASYTCEMHLEYYANLGKFLQTFSRKSTIDKINHRIKERVQTLCEFNSCFPVFPNEVIKVIASFLPIIYLRQFEGVNRHCKALMMEVYFGKALDMGYVGTDMTLAKTHCKALLIQTAEISYTPSDTSKKRPPLFPYKYIKIAENYTKVSIDQAEQIFNDVQSHLTGEEFCAMMSQPHACGWIAQNNRSDFKKYLVILGEKLLPTAPNDEKTKQNRETALKNAVKYDVFDIAKLLLKHMKLSKERRALLLNKATSDEMKSLLNS
jgi:hypothetical protein